MKTLRDHGTTDGCQQCTHVRAFDEAKPGLGHSDACRKRLLEAMASTAEGAARIQRDETRLNRVLAEHVEAGDRRLTADQRVRGAMGVPADEPQPGEAPLEEVPDLPREIVERLSETQRAQREQSARRVTELRGAAPGFQEQQSAENSPMEEAVGKVATVKELKETRQTTESTAEKSDDKEDFIALVMGNVFSDHSKSYQRERRSAIRGVVS